MVGWYRIGTVMPLQRGDSPKESSREEAMNTEQQGSRQGGHLSPLVRAAFSLDHCWVYKSCLQNILQNVYILKLLQS